jgi:hypothetical protein
MNRRKIVSLDAIPTAGTVNINSKKENALVWHIGTKFTNRNLEVALPATVYFEPPPSPLPHDSTSSQARETTLEDPFCVGSNAYISVRYINKYIYKYTTKNDSVKRKIDPKYELFLLCAQLNFKINEWTLTGLTVDKKQFVVFPKPTNKQLNVSRRLISNNYLIWNSWGKALYSALPPSDMMEQGVYSSSSSSSSSSNISTKNTTNDPSQNTNAINSSQT